MKDVTAVTVQERVDHVCALRPMQNPIQGDKGTTMTMAMRGEDTAIREIMNTIPLNHSLQEGG
ncbi:hypothetical protein SCALIN_C01_0019 [Candidatus Scalindua japonica]|uniref:Uncharacterized protein n=1 Tax=Candidatus Scalindua japonica TaxID=1284222 RepID=A0A286TT91_9BACT|nr:hypothetical protein SCALIN_C01_0019 [Candidatus Scalindua japonica]